MKFSEARLCLDCDWLHTEDQCPKCGGSEWVYPYNWSLIPPEIRPEQAQYSH